MFYVLAGIKPMYFRELVWDHLRASSPLCYRRYRNYKKFLRILIIHAFAPDAKLSMEFLDEYTGMGCSTLVYMMMWSGWLVGSTKTGSAITPKGKALVRACMRQVERDYSTTFLALQEKGAFLPRTGPGYGGVPPKMKKYSPGDWDI